jgi:hypothetical protein
METQSMEPKQQTINEVAARGGAARAKSLSPERRKEIAKNAIAARWDKNIPVAVCEGEITLGDVTIPCAVLENGKRVLTQSGFMIALGRSRQAKGRRYYDSDVNLPAFLTAKNLKPFVPNDLEVTSSQIEFRTLGGQKAFGYFADLLPKVCSVYLDARDAGALISQQRHVAVTCDILMRGLATVGIIALVDEATGYQDARSRDALAKILESFVAKELQQWVSAFPPDFYKEMFRLRKLPFNGKAKRPQYIGHLTNDLVYARLAPGILDELKTKNPRTETGHRKATHHQWLTPEMGHPKLAQHLASVTTLMKVNDDWDAFKVMLERALPKYKEMPLFKGLET